MDIEKLNLTGTSPYGYIVIKNSKTNEILFEGHNMITKEGKEFIAYKVLNNIEKKILFDNNDLKNKFNSYKDFEISSIEFGYNTKETQFTDTYEKEDDTIVRREIKLESENCKLKYNINNGHFYLEFVMADISAATDKILTSSNSNIINNIKICLSKETEYKLFSKANLDPIPFNEEVVFSLNYYVYF